MLERPITTPPGRPAFLPSVARPVFMVGVAIGLSALLPFGAGASDPAAFSAEEIGRLSAGELVVRPLQMRRGDLDLLGGSSWQVIDAPAEVVWKALQDVARYPKMLPAVKEAKLVAQEGRDRFVHLRQGAWPVFTSYTVRVRCDEAARALDFELDPRRPHRLKAGWGFARVVARRDGKTLLAFGVLADVGSGLLATISRPVLQTWMLKVPETIKQFLEHGGRRLY